MYYVNNTIVDNCSCAALMFCTHSHYFFKITFYYRYVNRHCVLWSILGDMFNQENSMSLYWIVCSFSLSHSSLTSFVFIILLTLQKDTQHSLKKFIKCSHYKNKISQRYNFQDNLKGDPVMTGIQLWNWLALCKNRGMYLSSFYNWLSYTICRVKCQTAD